jgi:hypothetical protein
MRFLLLVAILVAAPLAARGEEVRVDRIDIVDKGVYEITTGEATPDPNTPTGKISAVTKVKNIEATTAVRGRVGLEFGFQYTVVGAPAGDEVSLDIVNIYPALGIVDPQDPKPILENRYSRKKKIGETAYLGYGIENDWEIVPGTWTFEIWYSGRKLAEQSFTLSR